MRQVRLCEECRAELPGDAPEGLCPKCLVRFGGAELGIIVRRQRTQSVSRGPGFELRRFGDYEILERIGQGGMGTVYKARQLALGRLVALKLLPLGGASGPGLRQRFQAEASAAGALQHPNIVAVHDFGEQDGQPFFTMDYVEGRTLADLVRDQPLPAQRAATYLQTIAEAVHYAHQQGIIHRDLKPSNVLIDAFDQPRITDFGLAKRLSGDSDLTLTGQVLGSPNFISPEQAEGRSRAVGPASDVYSLGALLYHLLTRQPPFQADTLTSLLKQVLEAEPVPPRSLNPSIPKDMETICLKCLEKEPVRRYATAQALAEDLGRFQRGDPVSARPVGTPGKIWRWCQRRPALAGLSVALILTLLAGLAAVLWQLQRTRVDELTAQQNAYAADMSLAQAAVEDGDLGAALNHLNRHRPNPGQRDLRGWEWRYLWQLCRSDELFELTNSPNGIDRVAFSPNGRHLALHQLPGTLELWDVNSRKRLGSFQTRMYLHPFVFSQTGDLLAYFAMDWTVHVVHIPTQKEFARLVHTNNVANLEFSVDGSRLSALAEDATLVEWDIATKQPLRCVKFPISSLTVDANLFAFAPGGRMVAFRAAQGLGLWEPTTGRQTQLQLAGTAGSPTVLRFSADGTLLAAGMGEADSEICVWAVEDLWRSKNALPVPRHRFGKHRDWVCDLAFAPDGSALVSASADSTLRVWQFDHLGASRRYQGHRHQVSSVTWSPDGRHIASSGKDGSVKLWDPRQKTPGPWPLELTVPMEFKVPMDHYNLHLSAEGNRAIVLEPANRMVVIWDLEKMQIIDALDFAGTNHDRFAWSVDSRKLATSSPNGPVELWDVTSRRGITNFAFPGWWVGHLEFSSDGRFLVCGVMRRTGNWARACRLWDVERGHEVALPSKAMTNFNWCAFSPDFRLMTVLHFGGALDIWDLRTGHCQAHLLQPLAGSLEEGFVAFCPTGRAWASSTRNGAVALWEPTGKDPPVVVPRTTHDLWHLSFSADGTRLLVSGKSRDVVRLLDMGSKRFVATLSGKSDVYWLSWMTADGNSVYAVGEKSVLIWRAPSWAEIQAAEKSKRSL